MREPFGVSLRVARQLLVGVFFFASFSAGMRAQQGQTRSEPSTTLKVDVKLVNVFVTVTDAHGAPVGGLAKENFSLQEDGQEQKIAVFDKESAGPLSIALAVDTRWSRLPPSALRTPSFGRWMRFRYMASTKWYSRRPHLPRTSSALTMGSTTSGWARRQRCMTRFIWYRGRWTNGRGAR